MAAACDYDGPPLTASALIAADEARHGVLAADQPLGPDEAWDTRAAPPRCPQPFPDRPVRPTGPAD
jgi:hypothetical protein